jgi:hypothetical protein
MFAITIYHLCNSLNQLRKQQTIKTRAPDWLIPSPANPYCPVACELHSQINQNKKHPVFLAPPKTTHKAKVQAPLAA